MADHPGRAGLLRASLWSLADADADRTVATLCEAALCHAEAPADPHRRQLLERAARLLVACVDDWRRAEAIFGKRPERVLPAADLGDSVLRLVFAGLAFGGAADAGERAAAGAALCRAAVQYGRRRADADCRGR